MKNQYSDSEHVILVDESDCELGLMSKLEAHEKGLLHRAFSVFVFNKKGEMLLQQRASEKYHSPGLWSNSCCSHPRKGEKTIDAAHRRLKEEMGIECSLVEVFHFVYKAEFANGLTEHEYDHVFFGTTDAFPEINRDEVQDWKYADVALLANDMADNPASYTEWLKIAFERVQALYNYYRPKHMPSSNQQPFNC